MNFGRVYGTYLCRFFSKCSVYSDCYVFVVCGSDSVCLSVCLSQCCTVWLKKLHISKTPSKKLRDNLVAKLMNVGEYVDRSSECRWLLFCDTVYSAAPRAQSLSEPVASESYSSVVQGGRTVAAQSQPVYIQAAAQDAHRRQLHGRRSRCIFQQFQQLIHRS